MKRPTILVLGAGYGGLSTVVNLQKLVGTDEADIILVNKNDYHYESTWLHEASAGTLRPDQVRYDIQGVINKSKVQFVKATVEGIDVNTKKVATSAGEYTYDYLVIGLGFEGETFGITGLDKYALSIANVNAARQIRDHIEYQFATWSTEENRDDARLTIVVGGAGFSGIEFLGELDSETFDQYQALIGDPTLIKRARHAVTENERTLLAKQALTEGDLEEFGLLLNASHRSLKEDYEVTGIELDTLVENAWEQEGVIGSRMTGAGFGGCTVSIVKTDCVDKFIENVGKAYLEKIGYAADFYVVEIGDGGRVLE